MTTPLASESIGTGRRLVLCHGFTQNRACWGPFADDLARDHEVVLIDAPGHGDSGHDEADLDDSAALVGDVGGRAIYVGYSMGGRTALHLALARPALVEGLVLIGATAGLDSEAERQARRSADEALAARLLDEGIETFIDRWLAGPLFAELSPAVAARAVRLRNRPEGLAASLRSVGTGSQRSLWPLLAGLRMPVSVVAGQSDDKFRVLANRLVDSIGPNATAEFIDGGHAVHLVSPAASASAVRRLVQRVEVDTEG
ncbi:MAG: alpha/beta fold hydrolase [Actinomycetota bacterium]|nr:alpha/beta fold hydrolase [Actinomycetota bacterium]